MPAPNRFVTARLTFRQGSTEEWESNDPILLASEPGWDTTVEMIKFGDGRSRWSELSYLSGSGLINPEMRGSLVHAGTVIPTQYDSVVLGIIYNAAIAKAEELVAYENFLAGMSDGIEQCALIATAGANGSVAKTGTQTTAQGGTEKYNINTNVTITATPDSGYEFDQWVGVGVDDPSSSETFISMVSNRFVQALFKLPS